MKCTQCETILPPHYKRFPACGHYKLIKEEFAPPKKEEYETMEDITSLCVYGDIDDFEA